MASFYTWFCCNYTEHDSAVLLCSVDFSYKSLIQFATFGSPWSLIGLEKFVSEKTTVDKDPELLINELHPDKNQHYDDCAQERLRSALASAQSDQSLCCPHLESLSIK